MLNDNAHVPTDNNNNSLLSRSEQQLQTNKDTNNKDDNKNQLPLFIAVHCGAGNHSTQNHSTYEQLMSQSIQYTLNKYFNNNSDNNNNINEMIIKSLNACSYCLSLLENSPFTNAGYGSNLNRIGQVECDACLCYNTIYSNNNYNNLNNKINKLYTSVSSIYGVYNPILLCNLLLQDIYYNGSYFNNKLIKPIHLSGYGGIYYLNNYSNLNNTLNNNNHQLIYSNDNKNLLISDKSKFEYNKYISLLNNNNSINSNNINSNTNNIFYDTIGCILYYNGILISGLSSGGLLLKIPGRVGEASIYGSGTICEEFNNILFTSNFSGIGEDIMLNQMSNYLKNEILINDNTMESILPNLVLNNSINNNSINGNNGMIDIYDKHLVGCLCCKIYDLNYLEFGYLHSTNTMAISYYSSNNKNRNVENNGNNIKSFISKLGNNKEYVCKIKSFKL
ncbi:hypothetical protein ABK040_006264 [Willaertia magna]